MAKILEEAINDLFYDQELDWWENELKIFFELPEPELPNEDTLAA